MALLDMAQQYLGQNEVAQISQQLGIDPNVAQTARTAIGCNKAFGRRVASIRKRRRSS